MSSYPGFTRVASSFDPMEIRLAIAALEGAEIVHIPPPMQLTHMLPMNSLAYGPMVLHVINNQAEEAAALLEAIAAGMVIPQEKADLFDTHEEVSDNSLKRLFINILGYFGAEVSSPLTGLTSDKKRGR